MDLTKAEKALRSHGFAVSVFADAAAAAAYLNEQIDGRSVGFGGSETVHGMGLYESLGTHNAVVSHWRLAEGETINGRRAEAQATEIYLCSANGVSETGELVNIDGVGNRLAATLYGHRKVYFVVGRNKLAPTCEEAIRRARNVAGPKNAQRLGVRTPCAVRGDRCYDCDSPERICHGLVVLWRPMNSCEAEVVLIDEDLGY